VQPILLVEQNVDFEAYSFAIAMCSRCYRLAGLLFIIHDKTIYSLGPRYLGCGLL
jgi:hypothetical protein